MAAVRSCTEGVSWGLLSRSLVWACSQPSCMGWGELCLPLHPSCWLCAISCLLHAMGSVLVGLPFTAITFFVMQLGRKLHPQSASSIIGLLSASFGICQIAGPPIAAMLLARAPNTSDGFSWALDLAAATLVAGAAIYLLMVKAFPKTVGD